MKISCTINIGNYSNISIESSEHTNIFYAKKEMCDIAKSIREPAVIGFCNKYFDKSNHVPKN